VQGGSVGKNRSIAARLASQPEQNILEKQARSSDAIDWREVHKSDHHIEALAHGGLGS
jgi:hypothetical protein